MINQRLYWWLESNKMLNDCQAGFRAGQRTDDQLFRLSQRIIDGFHNKESTTTVLVDLQQAYDRVWRKGLRWNMLEMGIHGKMYQCIMHFLTNRTIQTKVHNGTSSKEILEEGLPQGSSLSCTLFLIFINDMPDELQSEQAKYADDLALWHSHSKVETSAEKLNEDLEHLEAYCDVWKLKVNHTKTTYSIFTKSSKVAKQEVNLSMGGEKIEKEEDPIYLGVQLDRQLTLKRHVQNLKEKATKRLRLG